MNATPAKRYVPRKGASEEGWLARYGREQAAGERGAVKQVREERGSEGGAHAPWSGRAGSAGRRRGCCSLRLGAHVRDLAVHVARHQRRLLAGRQLVGVLHGARVLGHGGVLRRGAAEATERGGQVEPAAVRDRARSTACAPAGRCAVRRARGTSAPAASACRAGPALPGCTTGKLQPASHLPGGYSPGSPGWVQPRVRRAAPAGWPPATPCAAAGHPQRAASRGRCRPRRPWTAAPASPRS